MISTVVTSAVLHLLSADTARASATEGRRKSQIDVLLGVDTDQEGRDVADLLANADMALLNQTTRVMDGLRDTQLEHDSLKTTLQDLGRSQTQHEIQRALGLGQQSKTNHTTQQSITLEDTGLILLIQGQQVTGGRTDLGQHVLNTPHLTLVAEPVLADELHLEIETILLERPLGLTEVRRTSAICLCTTHN